MKGKALALAVAFASIACSGGYMETSNVVFRCGFSLKSPRSGAKSHTLRINEVMSSNDGAWVDDYGETDDFVELINDGSTPLSLRDYALGDKSGSATPLPDVTLEAGATALFWADDSPQQGPSHLPFKLSAAGTAVLLWAPDSCELVDRVDVPELPTSESYARLPDGSGDFTPCRYATPERSNGEACEPPDPPNLSDDVRFAAYTWPERYLSPRGPLVVSELALAPSSFVEVRNASDRAVTLADYALSLGPLPPGAEWPTLDDSARLVWPNGASELEPGARLLVPFNATELQEGAVTIAESDASTISDRIAFDGWPPGASLSRVPDADGPLRFCEIPTPGTENAPCIELSERALPGGRTHRLATNGDFAELARGSTEVGDEAVKFVVDMEAGDVVHLLSNRDWALHYSWIREQIEGEPHLDRCDAEQARAFNLGWTLFSQDEYFRVEGRRYLLGTLVAHQSGVKTVEFTPGDAIVGAQMRRAFFAVMGAVPEPSQWSIRPTEGRQINELRSIEGSVPIVGPNAPYADLTYQSLNPAVGFGRLEFVAARDLETAELGPNVIVVTDDVPNDTAFMGGLITEAFQTPLAHVNVLARGRGTPNMSLKGAREDARLKSLFGKLVRLEVKAADFELREASAAEADAFWQSRMPSGERLEPVADLSVRGVVPLTDVDYSAVLSVGSKASGIAELYRVTQPSPYCTSSSVPLYVPPAAFAVPFAHYADHFRDSGAEALLAELEQDAEFRAAPAAHVRGLERLRQLLLEHPVDPELLAQVEAAVSERYGDAKVRFRSSSNTEDLTSFNGAGLHTSTSADISGDSASIEDALRTVWASLWNTRAYDEREFGHVDQSLAAMAVLVHQAWQEAAQGVAISRNALHATRESQYYINAQIGEASVTNPAPGVTSDEIVYTAPPYSPKAEYQARSSLSHGREVLSFAELQKLGCALDAIHRHFRPLVDPQGDNRLYAMQIEWKLIGPERRLLVKQARPYNFGELDAPSDCRSF